MVRNGWGASPSYFLPALFTGIRPEEPGFTTFRFSPQLTDIESLATEVPTPRGLIKSEVVLVGQTLRMHLTVPATTEAIVEVPKQIMVGAFAPQAKAVRINGGVTWTAARTSVLPDGASFVEETEQAIIFRVSAGSWTFEALR